jgi:hypothetical protein
MISFKQYLEEKVEVGKVMGHDHYIHKSYDHVLPQDELNKAKGQLPKDFEYTAIKHNKKEGSFSFIHSPDFDTAHEPTVGDSIKVHANGKSKLTKQSNPPKVWHHKHQWVKDDYTGFDVEESKKRSKEWKDKMGVNKAESSRIGSKTYWHDWLHRNGMKP